MSQAVGSRILVVSPPKGEAKLFYRSRDYDLSATVSSSLGSCGLSPEVVPETAELELDKVVSYLTTLELEEFACVVYVGSNHEVSGEAHLF